MILEYLVQSHLQDGLNILSNKDNLGYFSIKIDFLKLFEVYPDVGDKVLCSPIESLPSCSQDIIKLQQKLLEQQEYQSLIEKLDYHYLKRNVQARFFGLPVCPELHRTVFPKNIDLGCFLKVTGTVVRVTQSKMLEYQRKYVCMKCKYENCVQADFENRYILKAPKKCSNTETRCRCSSFTQVNLVSREHCKDYQEIKIQEQVNKLSIGTIPGSMWVVLENDLVDCCKPGDDVIICGTVRRRWRPSVLAKKCEVEIVLQANYIEVCNAQRSELVAMAPDVKDCFDEFWSNYEGCPLKGRDQILSAVCPQVYGLYLVKLALLLTVITGSNHIVENDNEKKMAPDERQSEQVRGQCHLLLVGDPGTGKSQLLRAGVDLTARSVFTSGAGSTRAGLTCAALREEGEWHLEAGALVLSDGGVCCIDEISQLREHDRTAIHEAMEQQTISVAKAGIVCKLNTRCAVIAACNPKGHYDTDQPLSVNVSLGTPLLSRFDLIFILLDKRNKHWDQLVSSYVLFGGDDDDKKQWSLEKLQMYISFVGPRTTKMTRSANSILQAYYMRQRKAANRDPSRTTVRMLDSLVRLSQAHCRLMYRTTILPIDAIVAISLVDLSMQDSTLDETVDALHSTIPRYADFEYLCLAKQFLSTLNLMDIWQEELLRYGKLLQVNHQSLRNDIEKGCYYIFTKFDDVIDLNIALSASVVTSSYFKINMKKFDNDQSKDEENKKINSGVSSNFAETLKKYSTKNKVTRSPPELEKKNPVKRKRKEVTLDNEPIESKIKDKTEKNIDDQRKNRSDDKGKKSVNKSSSKKNLHAIKNVEDDDILIESDGDIDAEVLLKGIPSVNDIFKDLGIGFKQGDSESNNQSCNILDKSIKKEVGETSKDVDSCGDSYLENNENVKPELNTSRIANKLRIFEHSSNIDCDKFYEGKAEKSNETVFLLEKVKENSRHNSLKTSSLSDSVQNTQISIFESSDYELDLDI